MSEKTFSRPPAIRAARARWAARRRRLMAYGQWDPFMPAEPVRAHLQKITDLGMPRKSVEEVLGLNRDALRHATSGTWRWGVGEKIDREVGEAVLAFWPTLEDFPDTASIDATGTRRRVEALETAGWSRAEMARRMGRSVEAFQNRMVLPRISAGMAKDVSRLYDALWNTRPEDHGVKPWLAQRCRARAAAAGFHGPLAWDDEDIDNPAALPQDDAEAPAPTQGENVADRYLLGESVVLDAGARRAVLLHLMEWTDLTVEQVAGRLEMTGPAVSRAWERAKARARMEGSRTPWRRVYIAQHGLLGEEGADAA
ncbi:hypothetical protein ACFC0S_16065 [Streptomyces sp. NPDC056084]|uniref:hypothetical protein n=1 Tax=unclassified Streptomyces TaxID=2593676 RepID=UPI0035D6ECCD